MFYTIYLFFYKILYVCFLTFVVETKQADEGAVRGPEWRLILLWSQWFEVGQLGWAGR